ncbi:MAG: hypothetical protein VYC39_15520 [Myxococcota bacterium]|nr:hypothetical protein [Myxococcota bacterium]
MNRQLIAKLGLTIAVITPLTCGEDTQEAADNFPSTFCPGQSLCLDEGNGTFFAGSAKTVITAPLKESLTTDIDGDAQYDPIDGDEFDDANANGTFDGTWMAGFGNARAAKSVLDAQWARVVALRQNETLIVLVAIDVVGYFFDEVAAIREAVSDLGIDHLSISATHTHEAADTVGIWGLTEDESGVDPEYMAYVRRQIETGIRQAVANQKESHVRRVNLRTRDLPGGMIQYQSDTRDPQIIDDEIRVLQFIDQQDQTIATLLNWGSHPEYLGDENDALSSDFPHWFREGIENGGKGPGDEQFQGVGGIAVFVTGALGSQIGPGTAKLRTWDNEPIAKYSPIAAEILGTQLAYYSLKQLQDDSVATLENNPQLGFAREIFFIDIQNRAYHTAILKKLFDRQTYNWDDEYTLRPGENEPDIQTEVAIIDIGATQIITVPGELDPALFVGGYDGSYTPKGEMLVDTSTRVKNPPELDKAPAGPYLRDLAREEATQVMLFGLTNDMLGYFVPEFDYKLHPFNPYFDEAEGDHYEETNSVGIDGWPLIKSKLTSLLTWRRQ